MLPSSIGIPFYSSVLSGGLAVGASSVVGPMYIAEISPSRWRGRFVAFFQFNIVLGIVLAYFSNYWIHGIAHDWQWMLGVEAIPAIAFALLLYTVPESPRWLIQKGNERQAMIALERIGNREYALAECAGYRESDAEAKKHGKGAVKQLFSKKMRLVLSIGLVIAVFQQLVRNQCHI